MLNLLYMGGGMIYILVVFCYLKIAFGSCRGVKIPPGVFF